MHFQNPWILILLPVAALLVFLSRKKEAIPSFQFSSDEIVENLPATFRIRLHKGIILFRLTALFLMIIA